MEQFVRDARIAMIYEGANGVQGLDLVARKLPKDGSRALLAFLAELSEFLAKAKTDASLAPYLAGLQSALGHLQQASLWVSRNVVAEPENAGAASTDYMHLFGLTALAYMWARMVKAVLARQSRGESSPALDAKLTLAKFFSERMLPETGAHLARLSAGAATMMAMPVEAF
jgi:hypothetical protein